MIVAGVKPSAYAGELLRLAAEFRAEKPALATLSLYMAERSALEARVESVLEPTSLRSGVTVMDVTKAACFALVSALGIAFACPTLAQDSAPPPPALPVQPTPPETSTPPTPPTPPTPQEAPEPPAPASPAIHVVAPHISRHAIREAMRAEAEAMRELHKVDWKRIRLETERARREAREAVERARPEIERAIAQAHVSEKAMRAMEEARPEIDAAIRSVGPEVQRALARAREDLKKAHIDMKIRASIDEALKNARVKIDMHERDSATSPDTPDDSMSDDRDDSAPERN